MSLIKRNKIWSSFNLQAEYVLLVRILILMLLFFISRLGFYLFNTAHYPGLELSDLLRMFAGGTKFDISAIMFINAFYVLLFLLPLPFRYSKTYQSVLKWFFVVTNGLALAANTTDFIYFDFILKRTTTDVFMFAQEGNIGTLLKLFLIDYWYGLLFWIGQMVLFVFLYNKTDLKKPEAVKKIPYYISSVLWIAISGYFSVIAMRGGFTGTTRPITLGNAGKYTEKPLEMAIVLNTPFTLIKTVDKKPLPAKSYFSDDELTKIYNPVHQPNDSNKFRNDNVVILIIESMGREYIAALNTDLDQGKYQGYTPFLDSLVKESKVFVRGFANGRKSIDALPSVVASIPSVVQPFVTSKYATNKISSLASLLKEQGYRTAFFHGAPNGSMGFESFMKVAGYENYFGMTEYANDSDFDGSWGIWDEEFLQYFARKMEDMEEPFHTSFFSVSSHHPFKIPEKYNGTFKKGTRKIHIPIQYTDRALKKFFDKAKETDWYKNTLFVITADHTNQSQHQKYKTSVGQYAVPVVFYHPGDSSLKGMDSTVTQQLDIMPTVLGYLNYPGDYLSFGFNVLDKPEASFAINYKNSTYQVIQDDYVLQFRNEKSVALYNYEKDPLQKNNLLQKNTSRVVKMELLVKAFIQQYNNRMINNLLTVN